VLQEVGSSIETAELEIAFGLWVQLTQISHYISVKYHGHILAYFLDVFLLNDLLLLHICNERLFKTWNTTKRLHVTLFSLSNAQLINVVSFFVRKVLVPLLLCVVLYHDLLFHFCPRFSIDFGLLCDFVWNGNIGPEVEVAVEVEQNLVVAKCRVLC